MTITAILRAMASFDNYHGKRLRSQLFYLSSLSRVNGGFLDARLEAFGQQALDRATALGAVTGELVTALEEEFADQADLCKTYTVHMVGHAHIDMNWMWGYHETVAATLETLRTVLKLMEEYPQFCFSQSQASVYEIVAKYEPEMLEVIKQRIHEGRWEVTAATWVEGDKNLASGDALCRQILHTKRYLAQLLEIDPDTLRLDYEPDTFGHSLFVPEILRSAGVEWMYHCRGCDMRGLYRWKAPSGKEVLVFQEPKWYLTNVDPYYLADYPLFCAATGDGSMRDAMQVYGVGDHGGGPTRRDLDTIVDMQRWPLFPVIKFSRYDNYYTQCEKIRHSLPVYEGEMGFILDGCYTTQTRLKMANSLSEKRLYDAEALCAMAKLAGTPVDQKALLEEGWRNTLFGQFHDILPGSCTIDPREYSMGKFQDTLAAANTAANTALRAITANIDTTGIPFNNIRPGVSEGAGVGYHMSHNFCYPFSFTERGKGTVRAWHIFNTTGLDRQDNVILLLWDYPGDLADICLTDQSGAPLPYEILEENSEFMQFHYVTKLLVRVCVPAFGYITCILKPGDGQLLPPAHMLEQLPGNPRRTHDLGEPNYVLENAHIRAEFDAMTCALISLVDKASGKELVSGDSGCFQYVVEDYPKSSDSAWRVGPAISKQNINRMGTVHVTDYVGAQGNFTEGYSVTPNDTTPVRTFQHCRGGMRCLLSYTASFHASDLSVTVTLDSGSKYLTYDVSVNWIQRGSHAGMPALRFLAQPGYHSTQFRYTTADGTLIRPELIHDVPSLGSMEYLGDGAMLHLFTAYKYGFRGWKDNSGVNLIRSSINPDPHPDLGLHRFQLHLGAAEDAVDAYRQRTAAAHSLLAVSAGSHSGQLPMAGQLLELKTDAKVSALYVTDSGAVAARLFNDSKTAVGIDDAPPYVRCNTLERPEDAENASSIAPYSYATILLK